MYKPSTMGYLMNEKWNEKAHLFKKSIAYSP